MSLRSTSRLAALACAAVAAGALAGCGTTQTVVKTVTQREDQAPARTASTRTSASNAAANAAELGDLLTLTGRDTTLKIRATELLDPLPAGEFDEPEPGRRFVGVRVAIKNMGPAAYADAVANGSTLILRNGEQADTTIVSGGPCDGGFGSDVKIAAGDKRVGCLAFEVPAGERVRSYQFTPNSGFADETGEWDLSTARITRSVAPASTATASTGVTDDGVEAAAWTRCDANISAMAGSTTCGFASNVFYEYWSAGEAPTVRAYSPATGQTYTLDCADEGDIVCRADDGAAVRFSQAAIDAYSQSQADAYAAGHDVG